MTPPLSASEFASAVASLARSDAKANEARIDQTDLSVAALRERVATLEIQVQGLIDIAARLNEIAAKLNEEASQ